MKNLLLPLFLCVTTNLYADYGRWYFFQCKIVTSDTTVTGFIKGPYEYLSDSVLSQFKNDESFFKNKLIADLRVWPDQKTLEVCDFAYVHKLRNALYVSENSMHLRIDDIKSLKLYGVRVFHFEPHRVISTLVPQDTVWCKLEPKKIIDDKTVDECCPNEFLVYDDKVHYDDLIQKIIQTKDAKRREKLLRELRVHKIVALRLCWCD